MASPRPRPRLHRRPRAVPRSRFRQRPRRQARRSAVRAAAALAVLVLTAGGVGHAVVSSAERELVRVDPFQALPDDERPVDDGGEDLNVLVIGTDSREGLSQAERTRYSLGGEACHCADTVMLLHLSADREHASVVSLPRDSYAELPAHTVESTGERHEAHPDKLNAALAHGGPALMVRTVEQLTELRVDHYLEVDFSSFLRAVDEVGGVDVCTTRPLRDAYSGLDLPAGSHRLDGETALAYVRARHVDGTADLGRIERQQRFLAAFLDRVASSGVLLSPGRLSGTATALLRSVRADPAFGAERMLDVAGALRRLASDGVAFASVPLGDTDRRVAGIGSTVTWDEEEAAEVFDALRADRPLPDSVVTSFDSSEGAGGRGGERKEEPKEEPKEGEEKEERGGASEAGGAEGAGGAKEQRGQGESGGKCGETGS
ncbi:LCP family protein [Streptomyces sp. 4N509B]|uniref:LCP family protein n=1 Tax=Streptomyces sp. 4N509B TaxID=3457413 RepID=UPI003FD0E9F1